MHSTVIEYCDGTRSDLLTFKSFSEARQEQMLAYCNAVEQAICEQSTGKAEHYLKKLQTWNNAWMSQPKLPEDRLKVVDAAEFLQMEFSPRENVLPPWLAQQGLAMIYAGRGIGKTFVSLGIAHAVASGGRFLSWKAPKARGVLFLDGEMPAKVLQERAGNIARSSEAKLSAPLRIVTPDLQKDGMIDLSRPEDQEALAPHLENVELVIVDNLATLVRTGKENEGEGWLPVQAWALQQRAAGRSVLFIHHAAKGGQQRGTSRREDVLDTVICLQRPADYKPEDGAAFDVHFEKARGIYGEDTRPFSAKLVTDPAGLQTWTVKTLEASTVEKVAELLLEGLTQHEIAEQLGIHKSNVSRAKNKAEALGLLTPTVTIP